MIKIKLRELRESRDLAQWEVGAVIRLDQGAVSRIERGKQELLLSEAVLLAEYFCIPITDLYEVADESKNE